MDRLPRIEGEGQVALLSKVVHIPLQLVVALHVGFPKEHRYTYNVEKQTKEVENNIGHLDMSRSPLTSDLTAMARPVPAR